MGADFKKFILRGNVVDMAVGIIIGASFTTIVKSMVDDILMPPLGLMLGGIDFSDKAIELKEAVGETPAVTMNYGVFFNNVISFLIVAVAVFLLIRAINNMNAAMEARYGEKPEPGEPTDKKCPHCLSTIPYKATRCAHCTSQLEATGKP
jgi:large conductance mechanosensitive channel